MRLSSASNTVHGIKASHGGLPIQFLSIFILSVQGATYKSATICLSQRDASPTPGAVQDGGRLRNTFRKEGAHLGPKSGSALLTSAELQQKSMNGTNLAQISMCPRLRVDRAGLFVRSRCGLRARLSKGAFNP